MEAWQQFLSQLEQELGPEAVRKWIPKLVRFDAANIYLEAADSFQISWFEEHVRPRLKSLLNISRRGAQLHGGRLWLEDTSEAGSTFCLSLPLVVSP